MGGTPQHGLQVGSHTIQVGPGVADATVASPVLVLLLGLIAILLAATVVLLASLPQRLQRLLFMMAREPLMSSSLTEVVNTTHTTSLLHATGSADQAQDVELCPLPGA